MTTDHDLLAKLKAGLASSLRRDLDCQKIMEYDSYVSIETQSLKSNIAVVELHKPTLNYHIQPNIDYCYQCQDGTPDEPYPCRTIQAIEKELR